MTAWHERWGSITTDERTKADRSFITSERFRILSRLGEGAMGVVYLARDRERGQDVALKTLHHVDATGLLHFKREFRSLAGISHPNLVSLYELFHVNGQWFFTMEVVDGVSFSDWVRPKGGQPAPALVEEATVIDGLPAVEEGTIDQAIETEMDLGNVADLTRKPPLDEGRLRSALVQLVSGVHALHRAGRLHRDLKPSNVRVLPSGRVVILDFGLVAELGEDDEHVTTASRVVGTAGYMSPEQAAGRVVGPASDWYAVGSMLYEALAGRRPFVGPVMEVLVEKSRRDGPPPRFVDASIPQDLDDLTAALLKCKPQERPSGASIVEIVGAEEDRSLLYRQRTPKAERPLVGRDNQLESLRRAFLSTDDQRSVFVTVRGDSGMGKSALVGHFCETLGSIGNAVVLRGACHEHETVRFRAFDPIVDALARYLEPVHRQDVLDILPEDIESLIRVFPVLRLVDAVESRSGGVRIDRPTAAEPREVQIRAARALRELFGNLARRMPVVLWIDDLQWGDRDSALLFTELLSAPDAPHIMVVATYRNDEQRGPLVAALEAMPEGELGPTEIIDLDPLSFGDAQRLAQRLLEGHQTDTSGLATSIARESGGNPYFIVELLRHLEDDADRQVAGIGEDGSGRGFSRTAISANVTLDAVLMARIDRLPGAARAVLEVLSLAVRPLPSQVVLEASALTEKTDLVWRLLESGNLVRTAFEYDGGERITPYHPRVREAVAKRIAAKDRTLLHARLAAALEKHLPEDIESLALHYHGAEEPALAAEYALRAARAAADGLAFDRAAELYSLAEELDPERAGAKRRLRAEALANAGRGLEAAEVFLTLARASEGFDALELRRRAAEQLLRTGHVDRGVEVLQHVLDDIGLSLNRSPKRAIASLVRSRMAVRIRGLRFKKTTEAEVAPERLARVDILWSVATGVGMIDTTMGTDFQSRHLVEALEIGEPYRVARALAMEACYSATGGAGTRRRTSKVVALADELVAAIDDPHATGLVEMAKGAAAFLEGRFSEGRTHSAAAETTFRSKCRGVLWEIATAQVFRVLSLAFMGELGMLDEFVRRNMREAQARNDRYAMANLRSGAGNLVYLVRDDTEGAHRALAETRAHLPADGMTMPHLYELIARLNLLLYEQRVTDAYADLAQVRDAALRAMVLRVQYLRVDVAFTFARVALAASASTARPERHLAEAAELAKRLESERATWAPPLGQLVTAGIAERRGRIKEAIAGYRGAADAAAAQQMKHVAASARWRAGALEGGDDGTASVKEALSFFRERRVARPERLAQTFAPATYVRG